MAEGDEYLDYLDETLEQAAKPLNALLGAFLEIKMACFELTVQTAVRSYHVYKDSWAPKVGEEFVCYQECANEHNRHTVAVYGDGDSNNVIGHLPREFLRVAFFSLEHDGSITGRVSDRRQY